MTCQESIVSKYVIVSNFAVMCNMTSPHDKIIITNNLIRYAS